MFKIRGADQKEYGPVTGDTIRQWIAQRRVDARTMIQLEGTSDWKAASEFPEFGPALASAGVAGPPKVPTLPVSGPASDAKTSGMAITSLVLGVLGCLGVTAIVGLVLGVVSLVRINRSGGRLKGSGLAIAGICVSGAMLFIGVPIMAGLLLPALAKAKHKARSFQTIQCVNNMKQVALGVRLYANDNGDQYPPGATWCDAIAGNVGDPSAFQCKDNPGSRSSFALNRKLVGKKETEVDPSTVMLFEFGGGWNMTGGPEMLPGGSRHGRLISVALADGSVQQVSLSGVGSLRWDP